jgi:hypothetical protein
MLIMDTFCIFRHIGFIVLSILMNIHSWVNITSTRLLIVLQTFLIIVCIIYNKVIFAKRLSQQLYPKRKIIPRYNI